MKIFGFRKQKRLLEWQKAVLANSPDKLMYTEEQLAKMTEPLIANDVRIITESMEIVANTQNKDTELSRKRLIAERAKHLEMLDAFMQNKYSKLIAEAKRLK